MAPNVVKVINYCTVLHSKPMHSRTYERPCKAGWEGVVRSFQFHSQIYRRDHPKKTACIRRDAHRERVTERQDWVSSAFRL